MNIEVGSIVTRISYNNDIIFRVTDIKDNIAYLKGTDIRLYADSPLDDLVLAEKSEEEIPDVEFEELNRDEYFYMPGKILHVDTDIYLSNKLIKLQKGDTLQI